MEDLDLVLAFHKTSSDTKSVSFSKPKPTQQRRHSVHVVGHTVKPNHDMTRFWDLEMCVDVMQILHQRLCVLKEYFEDLCLHRLKTRQSSKDLVAHIRPRRKPPSLTVTLVARSWEIFEFFGCAERVWECRRNWSELGLGHPWPFDMSDRWVGKRRDWWDVAAELQDALKEYREHSSSTLV